MTNATVTMLQIRSSPHSALELPTKPSVPELRRAFQIVAVHEVRAESVKATMTAVKWRRAVLAGLAANLASFVVGGGGYILFNWTFRLEPTSIWRWTPDKMCKMSVCWWTYLIVGNTLLALFLSMTYAVLYNGIPGRGIIKGLVFGTIVWLIGVLPAVFTIHVLTLMNAWSVLYFTIQAIVEHLIYGTIIAVVYGNPLREGT